MKKTLNDYKKNIFSQYGEDGIIEKILHELGINTGLCIEFGAWDGVLLSNTANLWTNGWKSILIEADNQRYEELKKVCSSYNVICINKFITPSGVDSLENTLADLDIGNIDLLSVDIDGNEYHVLDNLKTIRPKIIITEYNQTIPPHLSIISKENTFFGSSAKALNEMMKNKGYFLIALTTTNCIFIDAKYAQTFSQYETSLEELFDESTLAYLITGYDGSYTFSRNPCFGMGLPLEKSKLETGKLYFYNHSNTKVRWNKVKDRIKSFGKHILGRDNISKFKAYKNYMIWLAKNKPVPANGIYKWQKLLESARKYGLKIFIETGTAGGGTVRKMSRFFEKLYTIELDPTLFHQGKASSSDLKNITFLQGDSGTKILEILSELYQPALFWLDAHYSGDGTAKASLETPIVEELRNIFNHTIRKHVIVIDDMREFNGTHDYPERDQLEQFIKKEAPEYTFTIDNDLMIIFPKMC